MAAHACEVRVLHVKHSSSDEITVLVRDTAAVLTLRGVKLFTRTGGDSCGPGATTSSICGATRVDVFDVERDAEFLVSDYGVWNVNTSVLDGATLVVKQATATSCMARGGVAGAKRDHGSEDSRPHPPPRRRQRTSMV